jgi:hypothetical protein
MVLFGGATGANVTKNETWQYDVLTRTWTNMSPPTAPPGALTALSAGQPPFTWLPDLGLAYYHVSTNGGSDHDWAYDLATNTWLDLGALGGPPFTDTMVYDSLCNCLVAFSNIPGTGVAQMYVGSFGGAGLSGGSGLSGRLGLGGKIIIH